MSLEPLYNAEAQLIAWFDGHKYIFDTEMKWIAFVQASHVFNASTSKWLGPIHGLNCLDRKGKVVFWNPKQRIEGTLSPASPLSPTTPLPPLSPFKPIQPLTQMLPITPAGGWSSLDFGEWASGV